MALAKVTQLVLNSCIPLDAPPPSRRGALAVKKHPGSGPRGCSGRLVDVAALLVVALEEADQEDGRTARLRPWRPAN